MQLTCFSVCLVLCTLLSASCLFVAEALVVIVPCGTLTVLTPDNASHSTAQVTACTHGTTQVRLSGGTSATVLINFTLAVRDCVNAWVVVDGPLVFDNVTVLLHNVSATAPRCIATMMCVEGLISLSRVHATGLTISTYSSHLFLCEASLVAVTNSTLDNSDVEVRNASRVCVSTLNTAVAAMKIADSVVSASRWLVDSCRVASYGELLAVDRVTGVNFTLFINSTVGTGVAVRDTVLASSTTFAVLNTALRRAHVTQLVAVHMIRLQVLSASQVFLVNVSAIDGGVSFSDVAVSANASIDVSGLHLMNLSDYQYNYALYFDYVVVANRSALRTHRVTCDAASPAQMGIACVWIQNIVIADASSASLSALSVAEFSNVTSLNVKAMSVLRGSNFVVSGVQSNACVALMSVLFLTIDVSAAVHFTEIVANTSLCPWHLSAPLLGISDAAVFDDSVLQVSRLAVCAPDVSVVLMFKLSNIASSSVLRLADDSNLTCLTLCVQIVQTLLTNASRMSVMSGCALAPPTALGAAVHLKDMVLSNSSTTVVGEHSLFRCKSFCLQIEQSYVSGAIVVLVSDSVVSVIDGQVIGLTRLTTDYLSTLIVLRRCNVTAGNAFAAFFMNVALMSSVIDVLSASNVSSLTYALAIADATMARCHCDWMQNVPHADAGEALVIWTTTAATDCFIRVASNATASRVRSGVSLQSLTLSNCNVSILATSHIVAVSLFGVVFIGGNLTDSHFDLLSECRIGNCVAGAQVQSNNFTRSHVTVASGLHLQTTNRILLMDLCMFQSSSLSGFANSVVTLCLHIATFSSVFFNASVVTVGAELAATLITSHVMVFTDLQVSNSTVILLRQAVALPPVIFGALVKIENASFESSSLLLAESCLVPKGPTSFLFDLVDTSSRNVSWSFLAGSPVNECRGVVCFNSTALHTTPATGMDSVAVLIDLSAVRSCSAECVSLQSMKTNSATLSILGGGPGSRVLQTPRVLLVANCMLVVSRVDVRNVTANTSVGFSINNTLAADSGLILTGCNCTAAAFCIELYRGAWNASQLQVRECTLLGNNSAIALHFLTMHRALVEVQTCRIADSLEAADADSSGASVINVRNARMHASSIAAERVSAPPSWSLVVLGNGTYLEADCRIAVSAVVFLCAYPDACAASVVALRGGTSISGPAEIEFNGVVAAASGPLLSLVSDLHNASVTVRVIHSTVQVTPSASAVLVVAPPADNGSHSAITIEVRAASFDTNGTPVVLVSQCSCASSAVALVFDRVDASSLANVTPTAMLGGLSVLVVSSTVSTVLTAPAIALTLPSSSTRATCNFTSTQFLSPLIGSEVTSTVSAILFIANPAAPGVSVVHVVIDDCEFRGFAQCVAVTNAIRVSAAVFCSRWVITSSVHTPRWYALSAPSLKAAASALDLHPFSLANSTARCPSAVLRRAYSTSMSLSTMQTSSVLSPPSLTAVLDRTATFLVTHSSTHSLPPLTQSWTDTATESTMLSGSVLAQQPRSTNNVSRTTALRRVAFFAAVASLPQMPSAVLGVSRLFLVASSYTQCRDGASSDVDRFSAPLGLSIGHGDAAAHRGAVIGNGILWVGSALVAALLVLWLWVRSLAPSLYVGAGRLRFPGVLFPVFALFLQQVVVSSVTLLTTSSHTRWDAAIAGCGLSAVIAMCGGIAWVLDPRKGTFRAVPRLLTVPRFNGSFTRCVAWLIQPRVAWVSQKPGDLFVRCYGYLFDTCSIGRHWWLLVDVAGTVLISVAAGVTGALDVTVWCSARMWLSVAVCAALTFAFFVLRPFCNPAEVATAALLSMSQAVVALCAALGAAEAAESIGLASAVISAGLIAVELLCHAQSMLFPTHNFSGDIPRDMVSKTTPNAVVIGSQMHCEDINPASAEMPTIRISRAETTGDGQQREEVLAVLLGLICKQQLCVGRSAGAVFRFARHQA